MNTVHPVYFHPTLFYPLLSSFHPCHCTLLPTGPFALLTPSCFVSWSTDFNQHHLCGPRFGTSVTAHWFALQARQWLVHLPESVSCQQLSRKVKALWASHPSMTGGWQAQSCADPEQVGNHSRYELVFAMLCHALRTALHNASSCVPACSLFFSVLPLFHNAPWTLERVI